jgi:coatomer subunit beta
MLYWEVVDKVKEDKVTMKDEMIMVVNSLRSDVLHSNEYIRGRTMRLLSRIPYRAILESLTPSIVENLKHSHAYVRRNAL